MSSNALVTRQDPFPRRLHAYLQERFPPLGHGLLIVSYTSSNLFLARALLQPGTPVHYDFGSLAAMGTLLGFFFHLRVFDEHKDFADDARHHPERVLQRGVVRLSDLGRLAAVAVGVEFVLAALVGPAALVSLAVAFGFSLLMLREFFAREWLRKHFLVYATSHMLVMPLLAMVVFSFGTGRLFWDAPGWYWFYAFVGFFVTFNLEISRKIRAPEEEVEGLDTYTRIFGTYGAGYLVLAVRAIDTGMVACVGYHLGLSPWFYAVLILLYAVCLVGFLQFRLRTSPRTARRMQTYAALYVVAFDLTLAVEIARRSGIVWGGG